MDTQNDRLNKKSLLSNMAILGIYSVIFPKISVVFCLVLGLEFVFCFSMNKICQTRPLE